jgi:hypothetical protein
MVGGRDKTGQPQQADQSGKKTDRGWHQSRNRRVETSARRADGRHVGWNREDPQTVHLSNSRRATPPVASEEADKKRWGIGEEYKFEAEWIWGPVEAEKQ